ncbi:MAG: AAA family ATPase [Armatimonadetes bacterium]|nr:AAA family ATPase [Armatimonadota bacterium]MDE2206065.1 AAA family ATPase [Armatimonadota bacterium]
MIPHQPNSRLIAGRDEVQFGDEQLITDNLDQLLAVLPDEIRAPIVGHPDTGSLLEIVMDLGRHAEARFADEMFELSTEPVTDEQIAYVVDRVGSFGKDNRAGIARTLHRISAIRNRQGRIVGLTCRIGRAVYGTIRIIQDVVQSGHSILILGRPGRGKTTKLRETARVLSDDFRKRVVIVDTSNEIAGDGDIPHPGIGRARRMQVATPEEQHSVMIEAVENHMPEVIVIDEIGTEAEAFAARTIAERGVQLIGTAHGNSLENLMMNPTLSDLVGGIHAVTLSDDEARRRGTQKTVLERKAPPTFDIVIEIMAMDKLAIHHNVEGTVDRLLRGGMPQPEIRVRSETGDIKVIQTADVILPRDPPGEPVNPFLLSDAPGRPVVRLERRPPEPLRYEAPPGTAMRIFPYGVSRNRLERAIAELRVRGQIVRELSEANAVLALKESVRKQPERMREAANRRVPIYIIKSNTFAQVASGVRDVFKMGPPSETAGEEVDDALQDTSDAIDFVIANGTPVELAPANSYIRRLQHQLADRHQLHSESIGVEPRRYVRIMPRDPDLPKAAGIERATTI